MNEEPIPTYVEEVAKAIPGFVSYESWLKMISSSSGSNAMKARLVQAVRPARNGSYLDCIKLGFVIARLEGNLNEQERDDLHRTIVDINDMNKLPMVKRGDTTVQ